MVKESTLKTVRGFVDNLEDTYGKVSFAMALPNNVDDENSSLTLFLASSWIENKGQKESLTSIIERLREHLGDNAGSIVSRVSLVSASDPLATVFSPTNVEKSILGVNDCVFNGVQIAEAYIFENKLVQ